MTVIFELLQLNSATIPFFELLEGVTIVSSFGATFFCIIKNEYHRYLEILYLIFLVEANSNLKSKVMG